MDTVKMNAPMPDGNKCPQCGTPLPTGALAGQVRHSVRSVRGNQWMFRIGHPADAPLGQCELGPGKLAQHR